MLGLGAISEFAISDDSSSAIAASTYTFTGPTSGNVNAASSNFTVTPDGDAAGITITPATDGLGTFTPSSVTFTASESLTFTYTPSSILGSPHTLRVTNDGGLTDPASIDYTVEASEPFVPKYAAIATLLRPSNTGTLVRGML